MQLGVLLCVCVLLSFVASWKHKCSKQCLWGIQLLGAEVVEGQLLRPGGSVDTVPCLSSLSFLPPFAGLKTPSSCELVVGGEPQCWAEGRCLIFDDSFLHTAYHGGKSPPAGQRCAAETQRAFSRPPSSRRAGEVPQVKRAWVASLCPSPGSTSLLFAPPGSPEEGPRAVFMVDLWHPNVAAAERQALDFIFAPGR